MLDQTADTGCLMLDAGCWILDTGCWILDKTRNRYWITQKAIPDDGEFGVPI